jgi:hypothetical protein
MMPLLSLVYEVGVFGGCDAIEVATRGMPTPSYLQGHHECYPIDENRGQDEAAASRNVPAAGCKYCVRCDASRKAPRGSNVDGGAQYG